MNWIPVKVPKIQTFTNKDEDAALTVIKSGFEDQYHVIEESAHDGKVNHDDLFTRDQLFDKFEITVSI